VTISQNIAARIEEKKADYTSYGFTRVESNALKTFFDLAQEFESIEDIYEISVGIPRSFFNLNALLYIVDFPKSQFVLVAKSENVGTEIGAPPLSPIKFGEFPYSREKSIVFAVHGNRQLTKELPLAADNDVIGMLEIYPRDHLDQHQELFFQKYANRIGFNVHMRFLLEKYSEHIAFIKSLVGDIEHNVIIPNMVYKLFLRGLRGKIQKNKEIEQLFKKHSLQAGTQCKDFEPILAELREVNRGLAEEFGNIEKHYHSTSLFLETLLRKSHFDEGRLTLRTKACNMKHAVIIPQLERLADQFAENGITIDNSYSGIPDDDMVVVVDIGLMAQVYANLFSNALKYAHHITGKDGRSQKYLSYGREKLKNYFGRDKGGIKYNVFNTGPHIPARERKSVFEEGYRGADSSSRPGTGHGLAFVKNAVELHGGVAGYEPTPDGNNFYFILPE